MAENWIYNKYIDAQSVCYEVDVPDPIQRFHPTATPFSQPQSDYSLLANTKEKTGITAQYSFSVRQLEGEST